MIVMLTDGRGNIARSGLPGRDAAQADALAAARLLARDGIAAALLDTAPRPRPEAATLAAAMGARYVVLPRLEAGAVLGAVQGLAR
jgi:magnesium chelatase subunit D